MRILAFTTLPRVCRASPATSRQWGILVIRDCSDRMASILCLTYRLLTRLGFAVEVDLRLAMVREQNEWSVFLRHTNLFDVQVGGMWHSKLGGVLLCAANCVV